MGMGYFELQQDEETGRRYWFGSEDGWKDETEIGAGGVLTMSADHFKIGTVLRFSEPDEDTLSYAAVFWKWRNLLDGLMLWMVGWRDSLAPEARVQLEAMIAEYRS